MADIKYYGVESHFNENVTFYKNVNINGNLNYESLTIKNLTVQERSNLGITTVTDLSAQNLSVQERSNLGITTVTDLSAQNLSVQERSNLGITTVTDLSAQNLSVQERSNLGITTVTDLSAQNLSVSGIATVAQLAGVGAGTSIQIPSGSKLVGSSTGSIVYPGAILQVVQVVKRDTFSVSPGANTFGTVTGLSSSITPTSASSKILVTLDIYVGCSAYQVGIRLYRNGTFIGGGTPEGSRTAATFYSNGYPNGVPNYIVMRSGGMYLDSPASTSSLSYTVGIKDYGGNTAYVNRSLQYQNTSDYDHNGISTLTLMEVSA